MFSNKGSIKLCLLITYNTIELSEQGRSLCIGTEIVQDILLCEKVQYSE